MFKTCKKPPMSIISASGSICTFNALQTLPLKSHEVAITAIQSGSGTPSPSNPRAISGYSAINISHSDADTSNPTVYTIQIGSTVYGGTYNAITGILTVTHRLDIYDENSSFSIASNNRFTVGVSGIDSVVACNLYEPVQPAGSTTSIPNYRCRLNGALDTIAFRNTDISDLAAWNTWISNNNIQVLYKLATPTTIQLPPCPIDTLLGVNNIWADTGNTNLSWIKIGR